MPEVSRFVHTNNVQIFAFDIDQEPMRMLTSSLQVAQRANRRCPSRGQHPARDTDLKIQDRTGWAAVHCKAVHAGTEDRIREGQDKATA